MNKWLAMAALTVACSTAPAYALESFSVPYGGVATIPIDCTFQPLSCGIFTFTWRSVLTLQTVSGADGVYTFDSFPPDNPANTLTFLSLVSDKSATGAFSSFDLSSLDEHLLGGVSATLQGGRVVAMNGLIVGGFQEKWNFAGEALTFNMPLVSNSGPYSGQAAMIPEPSTYALMLGGLVAAGLARRRLSPPGASPA